MIENHFSHSVENMLNEINRLSGDFAHVCMREVLVFMPIV